MLSILIQKLGENPIGIIEKPSGDIQAVELQDEQARFRHFVDACILSGKIPGTISRVSGAPIDDARCTTSPHEPAMSNDNHPIEAPTATSNASAVRRLRLRIIPGTFLLIFTSLGVLGFYFQMWEIASINSNHDWTRIDPRHRAAMTPLHVTVWLLSLVALQCAGVATYAWFYGKWTVACIGTIIFFALMYTAKAVESL